MGTKIVLTKSGMGIEEGTVVRWLKGVGDEVTQGEIVVEVETAKSVIEIEAPVGGILSRIYFGPDETLEINGTLGEID